MPRRARTIPARAGNTVLSKGRTSRPEDHPRSRGEHLAAAAKADPVSGPSPLARGTPSSGCTPTAASRTIPARAGNTRGSRIIRSTTADHPRSRGEHVGCSGLPARVTGPSPLARGTRIRSPAMSHVFGTIPARAGNTRTVTRTACTATDHPRSRGEHLPESVPLLFLTGPSPLARGTHFPRAILAGMVRTIPARAGNTLARRRCRPRPTDHPRSRGEHRQALDLRHRGGGPSPLARGTHRRTPARTAPVGTIPARAGNTRGTRC